MFLTYKSKHAVHKIMEIQKIIENNLLEIWCRFSTQFNRSANLINTDYTSTKLASLTQRCLLKVRVVSYKTFPQLITLTAMAF